jgi:hypothetical protein
MFAPTPSDPAIKLKRARDERRRSPSLAGVSIAVANQGYTNNLQRSQSGILIKGESLASLVR